MLSLIKTIRKKKRIVPLISFDTSLNKKSRILPHFSYFQLACANSKMEESNYFFHFRKFYGQTQLQNFEQQNWRKSGQMKHFNIQCSSFSIPVVSAKEFFRVLCNFFWNTFVCVFFSYNGVLPIFQSSLSENRYHTTLVILHVYTKTLSET